MRHRATRTFWAVGLTCCLTACVGQGDDPAATFPGTEDDPPWTVPGASDAPYDPFDDGPVATPTTAERYAQARCEAFTACECESSPFAGAADCERIMASGFRYLQHAVADATLDIACFETELALLGAAPCALTSAELREAFGPPCWVYRGQGRLDDPCVGHDGPLTYADTCGSGLACQLQVDGYRCAPQGTARPEASAGDLCGAGQRAVADCGATLYCDPQTLRCAPRPAIDARCNAADACPAGAWCSGDPVGGTGVCRLLGRVDAPCASSGACAPTQCEGASCAPGACVDGHCATAQPLVCAAAEI